jgi:hypothetical protein
VSFMAGQCAKPGGSWQRASRFPPGARCHGRAFLRGAAGVARVHDATNARCRLGLTWHTPPRCIARHGSRISPGLAPHAPVLPGLPRGVDTTIATRSARRVV